MKLIRVNRTGEDVDLYPPNMRGLNRAVMLINPTEVKGTDDGLKTGEFFSVDDNDADRVMKELARINPGVEIELWTLTGTGMCPAGEFVAKEVTKDGILPSFVSD